MIEILMVVVALAIIAGVVLPQVSSAIDDAKHSTMLGHLHELTNLIQQYRIDHDGLPPDLVEKRDLPQLTGRTNGSGDVGMGPGYYHGPYLKGALPENPLNGSRSVFRSNSSPPANLENRIGWVYHPETGQIWAGLHRGKVDEGIAE